ncbi:GNAT family N-acetyltransferase [Pseudonocardia sp. RS11V-5]|uniref:GNAT family N-acetyltransferase n=1 Tax=Pseudonocardia terrae TaxID=2905831 RepID=UPI001E3F1BAB|nr:GNAT family N-acetyltransferase [Pseudonocardia terrae]MCE3550537.1 GNAT family N-acetyltransferase [Pseudonocardia terrae]
MSAPATLLHLTTPAEWRTALRTGAVTPPSLAEVGFVHLSTADQVALPAERLFAGRRDLVLLAVDAATVGCAIRYEPGVPGDPASMRFPHAYGPVPVSAVVAVSAFRPGPDGAFEAPAEPPARADRAGRLRAFADSLPRRVASAEVPVAGGLAVLQDDVPWAPALNRLLVDDGTPAQELAAEADRVLGGAGRAHRCVTIRGTDPGPVARELGRSGWWVQHDVVMARRLDDADPAPAPAPDPASTPPAAASAEEVPLEAETELAESTIGAVRDLWTQAWRPDLPPDDPRRLRLPDRYLAEDRGTDLRILAVCEGDEVVAAAALYLDGATAVLEAIETAAPHRGRGHGNALLDGAVAVANRAGCDLLALHAQADSAPRDWYARHGFRVLDDAWSAGREP